MTITADDVRKITGLTSATIDYSMLENYIGEAELMIYTKLGRYISERFTYTTERSLTHHFRYKPITEVLNVMKNWESNEMDAADYTVSLSAGTITFDDDEISSGDVIYLKYVPQVFETIILYQTALLALQRIALRGNVDAAGGERVAMIKAHLAELITTVRNRPVGRATAGGWKYRQWRRGL